MRRAIAERGIAGLLAALGVACSPGADAPSRAGCASPNVLLYTVDTLRADGLPRYGNPLVEAPATDLMAREGSVYANATAPSSWTRPSVASILTGLHPETHAVLDRDDSLAQPITTLAESFAAAGYATGAVVANPNVGSYFGFGQGFAHFEQLYDRREPGDISSEESVASAAVVHESVETWLTGVACPYFLFVLTVDPHWPYEPPASFDRYGAGRRGALDRYQRAILSKRLSGADRERARHLYFGEVAYADAVFGGLLDWMRADGSLDETVVVFTSDHGEEFWEHDGVFHGKTLYREALHVPLLLRHPATVPIARIERPVSLVDIAPTLLELAGIPPPYPLDGGSLLAASERSPFATLALDGVRLYAIERPPWKLVSDLRRGVHALYDLESDPEEQFDVASRRDEVAAGLVAEIARREAVHLGRRKALLAGVEAAPVEEADLPAEARDALEALGYLEPDSEEPR